MKQCIICGTTKNVYRVTKHNNYYCVKHRYRLLKYGDPEHLEKVPQPERCIYCDSKPVSKGLCQHHYDRARLRGDPLAKDIVDGRKGHPLYRTWIGIKDRCCNPNSKYWRRYGGRGITICERWLASRDGFWNFVEDMGPRPPRGTVDRIDNDKGYCKENCRWATLLQQAQNRRRVGKSGAVGVCHVSRQRPKRWCAYIVANKKYHSKYFATKEEAIAGRKEMEEKYGATPEVK